MGAKFFAVSPRVFKGIEGGAAKLAGRAVYLNSIAKANSLLDKFRGVKRKNALIDRISGLVTGRLFTAHVHLVFNKEMFELAWERFGKELEETTSRRLRHDQDVSIPHFVSYLAYYNNLTFRSKSLSFRGGFNIKDEKLGCINKGTREEIEKFFKQKFPEKSSFEL